MTALNTFAQVHLDRQRRKVEIRWVAPPAKQDFLFLMDLVERLMSKYQIQQLIQNNLHN